MSTLSEDYPAYSLESTARQIRREIIELAHRSGAGHAGSALSCVEILTALYFAALRLDPWEQRDIFILSKAHAAMALYAALAVRGIMPVERLQSYYRDEGSLPGHLDRMTGHGVECSAGSLGHGFSIAIGMAYGFKQQRSERRVFCVIGDGESQEGSVWEGAMFAPRLGLDNMTAIMDCNRLQGYGRPDEICSFEPIGAKWAAFGWHVCDVDGHDSGALQRALAEDSSGRPKMIIARTVKGKGVSFMEDQLIWHYYIVTAEYRARALEELA